MKKAKAIVCTAVALGTFFAGLLSAAAAQLVPAGAVACYFAGRAYLNLMPDGSGQGLVVEYFTNINGISGPLFKGPPSESTAFFTLRSNLFSFTSVRPDGDIVLQLVEAGTFDIYYNPTPQIGIGVTWISSLAANWLLVSPDQKALSCRSCKPTRPTHPHSSRYPTMP
jgi:hypothetical protein